MKNLVAISFFSIFIVSTVVYASSPPEKQQSDTVEIPAALGLTGVSAAFGTGELNGATLAIEEANQGGGIKGKKIVLKVEDTQSSNRGVVTAVTKLISRAKGKFILGPTWIDSYSGGLPLSKTQNMLFLTPSAAAEVYQKQPGDYPLVFSVYYNATKQLDDLLKYIAGLGKKKLALIFDEDPYFEMSFRYVVNNAKKYQIEVVHDGTFQSGTTDYRAALAKIKNAGVDGAIFGIGDEGSVFAFLKQRKELYPDLPLFGNDMLDAFANSAQFVPLFEGIDFFISRAKDGSFAEKYQKRFSTEPAPTSSTAYDATNMLIAGMREGHFSSKEMREFLVGNEFETVTFGKIRLNQFNGISASEIGIKQVRNGKVSVVQ